VTKNNTGARPAAQVIARFFGHLVTLSPCHLVTPIALLVPLAACPAARAQAPREELVRLVPDDVALCLVINDLRGQHDKLLRSPWIKRVSQSPLGKALREAPELLRLGKLKDALRKNLGVTWPQLRDEILGDAVVLAYRPGPPGKPEQEEGLLLLWARDRELLATIVGRLNEHQRKAGELKEVQARKHAGLTYHRRVEAEGESFYFLDGPVLAFAAREGLLRQALERRASPKAAKALPLTDRLKDAGTERALATLWINPRAFDDELRHQAEALAGAEGHALRTFLRYWKALEGVSLSLEMKGDPEVVLALHARTEALPAAARRVVETAGEPTDLWQRFPQDSILTAAARVDLLALTEALGEFLTPEARSSLVGSLHRDLNLPLGDAVMKQFLARLGPDCGLCVAAAPDKSAFPHVLIALRIRPGPPGSPPADKAIEGALTLFAGLAVLEHNRKEKDQMALKKEVQDGVEVRYFVSEKKFPPGLRPAFAVKGGYLVLASSPEAVRRFAAEAGPAPPRKDSPLLRLSLRRFSQHLKDRKASVLDFLGNKKGLPKEQAGELLEGLVWALDLFDTLELTQHARDGRVSWVARLRTWVPKK
jgi:hypothetical protein